MECNTTNLAHKVITYEHQPPSIEWHIAYNSSEFTLMNVGIHYMTIYRYLIFYINISSNILFHFNFNCFIKITSLPRV